MEKMLTLKYENNSGHWFSSEYIDNMAHVVYEWKKTGGVAKTVQLWDGDVLVNEWSK